MRSLMADLPLPEYSDDSKMVGRVGTIIGETAGHEERHVRASDSGRDKAPSQERSAQHIWPLSVAVSMCGCTATLLGVLAYWQFG